MVVYGLAEAVNCKRSTFLLRAVNLIVSCTNRKRFGGPAETAVHGIGGRNLAERLKLWKAHLRSVQTPEYSASDLYMGDHWSVVRSIPTEAEQSGLKVRTWICSAGYGLIGPATPIKPYRATFTRGEADYVASGLPEEASALDRWWRGVCSYRFEHQTGEPRTIQRPCRNFPAHTDGGCAIGRLFESCHPRNGGNSGKAVLQGTSRNRLMWNSAASSNLEGESAPLRRIAGRNSRRGSDIVKRARCTSLIPRPQSEGTYRTGVHRGGDCYRSRDFTCYRPKGVKN